MHDGRPLQMRKRLLPSEPVGIDDVLRPTLFLDEPQSAFAKLDRHKIVIIL